ncbi:progestin and adipoQ receptor family member 3 isoform X1 [Centrocercus urophasianus]|uniref:progestin and adipoQ receptor family member 3 isoform X1 n=1 Tax=Centrocercus urophasianus TaxID=9002 RepID=UPI001C64B179|nr:progestin and adipoQ receptor family member 3 isoform X1 [Centrocercus urophasianus]
MRGGQDAAEAAAQRALHRAGRLPVLARAAAARHPSVHLRADPRLPEGQPLHHRRLPRLPALAPLSPQPLYPLQRERQHLEPPAGLPAFLHAGNPRPDRRAARRSRRPRGLRHLRRLPLLLPGGKKIDASQEAKSVYCVSEVCMLCSVGYHLFCCHRSEKTSRRWMALDYAGISIGILGCYVSGVFYAFYCSKYWRQVYLITVLAMILAVFFVQIHPNYLTQQWRRLRSIIFCSVSGYGIIPTIHWVSLNGGIGAAIVQEFAPRVVVMYFIAAVAFLFYISKVPERYFPGQLNYLGSSHQIWHILAVVMLYWWHQSAVYIMQYRHSKPCPEHSVDL